MIRLVPCFLFLTISMFADQKNQKPPKAPAQTNKTGGEKAPTPKQDKLDPSVPAYLTLRRLNEEQATKPKTQAWEPLPVVTVYKQEFTCIKYGKGDIMSPSSESIQNADQMPQDLLKLACENGYKQVGSHMKAYGVVVVSDGPTSTQYVYGAPLVKIYQLRPGQTFQPQPDDRFVGTLPSPVAK
jgi:hypothetical protein